MAAHHNSIHHSIELLLCLLLLVVHTSTATLGDEGFTMELIHRYSKGSPFYKGNLTESELIQTLVESSRSRVRWLESTRLGANITTLRPLIGEVGLLYLVHLSIGTGDGKRPIYLHLDTGSSLTWTQCKPCSPSFPHPSQLFDPLKSPSYDPLPHNHRLCTPPFIPDRTGTGNCNFEIRYMEGSTAEGVLSQDTFWFEHQGRLATYSRPVFGCAHSTRLIQTVGSIDGIFGMGRMAVSILMQLSPIVGGRFSYCLVKPGSGKPGFLRFKDDFRLTGRSVQKTRILLYPGIDHYYLTLDGVSVNDRRLRLPHGTFHRGDSKHGGCTIDTATTITYLIKPAYAKARAILVRHFESLHLHPTDGRPYGMHLDLCYNTAGDHRSALPSMTLHFERAHYRMDSDKVFWINDAAKVFCWAMAPAETYTILGAHQQYNTRFAFDIRNGVMSFAPEDCAADH